MPSSADILVLGTHAGRPFLRYRSNASSRLPMSFSFTSARATCGRPGDLQLASAKTVSALSGTPSLFSARDHFVDAVLPDGLELGDSVQQRLILRVEKIAEDVDFGVLVFGGEFRAGDEFHLDRRARRRRARAALDRVVVRQRDARAGRVFARARPVPPA